MGLFSLFGNEPKNKKYSNVVINPNNVVSINTGHLIKNEWTNIEAMLKGGSPAQLKQALITADKLLDPSLMEVSSGVNMSERLRNIRPKLDRDLYQKMWEAHNIRNTLVHEVGHEPQHFILREAVTNLKKIFIQFGVKI